MGGGRANTDFRRAPRAEAIAMPDIEVRGNANAVGTSAADASASPELPRVVP